MNKRVVSGLLSLILLLEAPGFAGYQAFAAVTTENSTIPQTPVVPAVNAPISPIGTLPGAELGTLPQTGIVPNANIEVTPQADGIAPTLALPTAASQQTPEAAADQPIITPEPNAAQPQTGVGRLSQDANVQAAVDTDHPQGQAPALGKVYEGIGPKGQDRAVFTNNDGPFYKVNYQPATRLAPSRTAADTTGRTPVHILIGAGGGYGRGWSADWTKDAVGEIAQNEIPGLKSLVIDSEKNRPADAEHFIAADLSDVSEENKKALGEKVVKYLNDHHMIAMGANALIQGYIRMAPVIQAAVKEGNNPNILVNPAAAVEATVDKLATRMIVGEQVERLKWPAASPGTIADPDIEEKAVATFREIKKQTPSGKVVLKLVTAAGKAGLRAGGIETDDQMREAVREVITELKDYWGANPAMRTLYIESENNGPSRFLIEGLIDRLAEVDVELSMSVLKDGTLDIGGFIIGNPNPGDKEKGYLYGMNGLLSAELQRMLILAATEAVVATWKKHEGLPFGNFHVELILRGDAADPKPALVEINATRPIGGNGVRFAKEWHSEINLIRNGIRASLGLPQLDLKEQPKDSLLALGITPSVSGTITKIESSPELAAAKFSDFGKDDAITKKVGAPVFLQLSEIGEHVDGAETPHPGGLGAMAARGKDAPDAVKNILAGLDKTSYDITKANGEVHTQKGSEEHSELDYRALPSDKPHLSAKATHELDAYEEAQLRWVPIFKVYSPLFSALMNSMGGLAAIGIGRMGYSLALFVSTPFASVVASHLPVKKILKYTWAARIAIWAALVPLALFLFPAGAVAFTIPVLGWGVTSLQAALFGINFLDGLMVSFSHTVDMDAGGMDQIAKQNGFKDEMSPEVRKHYGTRYMAWSSKAQYIFPLGIAAAVMAASYFALPIRWAFLAGMAGVFLVQGARAIWSINKLSDDVAMPQEKTGVWKEFTSGVKMVWKDKKLRGIMALESFERAIGDVLFMVAFPMLGLFAIAPALHLNDAGANLAATILMSIMSYAGMKASIAARKNWKAPEKGAAEYPAYKKLYPQMFIAGLTLLSIPAAYALMSAGMAVLGLAVAAVGAVAFMMSFKKAQIGAMNMFQTAAGEHEGSTRIFGLASAISMLFSGFAVWALESLFPAAAKGALVFPGALPAFLGVAAFFIAVGAGYWLIWPRIASKTAKAGEKKA